MKILFVAVFDEEGVSSNTSQAKGFEQLGHKVIQYNYRVRAERIGSVNRDMELIDVCATEKPELVVFAKTNTINPNVLLKCKDLGSKVCYWFPDPFRTYNTPEFLQMTKNADFFCADKKNVTEVGSRLNPHSYKIPDGFDSDLEIPRNLEKDIDVSFIGSLHSDRAEKIKELDRNVQVFSNAFGKTHSEIVSRSKICINFCTTAGASDRTYKTLAAGGFYLSDDWDGRSEMFQDNRDLVVYDSVSDLREKIDYYLENPEEREKISAQGMKTVQGFSRLAWAKKVLDIYTELYFEM